MSAYKNLLDVRTLKREKRESFYGGSLKIKKLSQGMENFVNLKTFL